MADAAEAPSISVAPLTPNGHGGAGGGAGGADGDGGAAEQLPNSPGAAPPVGDGRVKVACRVRPLSSGEVAQGNKQIVIVDEEVG